MTIPFLELIEKSYGFTSYGNTLLFTPLDELSDSWRRQQNESIARYQDDTYEADETLGALFGGFIATTINRDGLTLDIGCGLHPSLPHYVKHLGLSRFLGIEPLPIVVERDFPCLAGVCAEAMPLKDAVADTAIFATSLDHIENAAKAVKEVLRTLKADGRCYFWLGVHDPFILAEAKTFGVVHNHAQGWRKWVRIIFSPVEHLYVYHSMRKRARDLTEGKPLDTAHVRYHTVAGIEKELASYGLRIKRRILVPGSGSLFVEAHRNDDKESRE